MFDVQFVFLPKRCYKMSMYTSLVSYKTDVRITFLHFRALGLVEAVVV